jgi:ferredoxin
MQEITEKIQTEARRLLQEQAVDLIIGYQQGWDDDVVTPCFVRDESETEKLVFDEHCTHNLANYLVGREGFLTSRLRRAGKRPRVGLVARPGTLRAIVGLIQERQIGREDLVILGIVDGTPVGIQPDVEVGRIAEDSEDQERIRAQVRDLEDMSPSERWAWWEREFSKCIRCYACRQACPFCYCEQCIADENQPQWIGRSPSPKNNRSWNVIRALHLVGRCIGCRECERVCPMKIPLSLINTKMATRVEEAFEYVAGANVEASPALNAFQADDPNEFIK